MFWGFANGGCWYKSVSRYSTFINWTLICDTFQWTWGHLHVQQYSSLTGGRDIFTQLVMLGEKNKETCQKSYCKLFLNVKIYCYETVVFSVLRKDEVWHIPDCKIKTAFILYRLVFFLSSQFFFLNCLKRDVSMTWIKHLCTLLCQLGVIKYCHLLAVFCVTYRPREKPWTDISPVFFFPSLIPLSAEQASSYT